MSNKTIARFLSFVICVMAPLALFCSCTAYSSNPSTPTPPSRYAAPRVTGKIRSKDIEESSGITASRCQPDVLWTHNDSGDDAYIYAMDPEGESRGTWRVPNAQNDDWEDIASYKDPSGKCFIYIGDTGDNKGKRTEHKVYRVPEPQVSKDTEDSDVKSPLSTALAQAVRFSYPDYAQDAEALLVHPQNADIYIVTKRISGPAGVYRLHPDFAHDQLVKLEKIAEVSVPSIPNGLITGGDISPDGQRVILCDYTEGYELTLPTNSANFDVVWQQTPDPVDLGKRPSGESVSYSMDGRSLFASSEGKHAPIIEVSVRQ